MTPTIRIQVLARDCANDPMVQEYLNINTYLSRSLRACCVVESRCLGCKGEKPGNLQSIQVNGEDFGAMSVAALVDLLHTRHLGIQAA